MQYDDVCETEPDGEAGGPKPPSHGDARVAAGLPSARACEYAPQAAPKMKCRTASSQKVRKPAPRHPLPSPRQVGGQQGDRRAPPKSSARFAPAKLG
jgi:hypothetical protein